MSIRLKRVYDKPGKEDGYRILVDRLWPRGLSKQQAKIDLWLKEAAPSTKLRKWYGHDPSKWKAFKSRYFSELMRCQDSLADVLSRARRESVTFVFSSKEERFNNAVALKEYLEKNG